MIESWGSNDSVSCCGSVRFVMVGDEGAWEKIAQPRRKKGRCPYDRDYCMCPTDAEISEDGFLSRVVELRHGYGSMIL